MQDMFCFSCHRGVSCWNKCCYGTDVTLTPHCILRLSRRFELRPAEFLQGYTVPGIWEKAGLPVAKLKMAGEAGTGPCVFLDEEEGCTVYSDRPATCRYYPLGLAAMKLKESDEKAKFHFLVKEPHCKGHEEDKLQSVEQFRREQEVEAYDEVNQGWMDILMKMASWMTMGGPQGKDVPAQTKKMFYMASTDVDAFRRFVFDTKFLQVYEIDPEAIEVLKFDDIVLLQLGFDWLKNVMFNEPTIAMRESVLREAIAATRTEIGAI
jgi:Fe-S-cluster containining protein